MPLQKYTFNNIEYYVDYRLKQFRTAVPFPEPIDFIDFSSEKGDEILMDMIRNDVLDYNQYNP